MSDKSKNYYLRLNDDFFESEKIIVLESMKDGYLYLNIFLKLYLRSLKSAGKLMLTNRIPYDPKMLASITGHSVGVVENALDVLYDLNLIDILDDGIIYIPCIDELPIASYDKPGQSQSVRKNGSAVRKLGKIPKKEKRGE